MHDDSPFSHTSICGNNAKIFIKPYKSHITEPYNIGYHTAPDAMAKGGEGVYGQGTCCGWLANICWLSPNTG